VAPVIRGRPHLVGAESPLAPATLAPAREGFPLLARPARAGSEADLEAWGRAARRLLDERLADAGAVLLRGLPLPSLAAFSRFVEALGYEPMPYGLGAASRRVVAPNVATANAAPPERTIMLHNDMSYEPVAPRHLFLFCERALRPGEGGETPIARGEDWLAELGEELVEELERRGLRRGLRFGDARVKGRAEKRFWQAHFGTEDPAQVERECAKHGLACEWHQDGSLTTWGEIPITSTRSGKRMWFCSPQMARPASPLEIRHRDGSPLAPELLERLRAAQWKVAVAFAWRSGDVLCLDNLRCQHGRLSYAPGAERRVFISMATPA
jgi:alpha-ketoglutarate-dependent taurine dioxygenase